MGGEGETESHCGMGAELVLQAEESFGDLLPNNGNALNTVELYPWKQLR